MRSLLAVAFLALLPSCLTGEAWTDAIAGTRVEGGVTGADGSGDFRNGKHFAENANGWYLGLSIPVFRHWDVQRVRIENAKPTLAPEPAGDCESCDAPHPRDKHGALAHDYMRGGDGSSRCWYCDAIEPAGPPVPPVAKSERPSSSSTAPNAP